MEQRPGLAKKLKRTNLQLIFLTVGAVALVATACSGESEPADATTVTSSTTADSATATTTVSTTAPTTTTTAAPSAVATAVRIDDGVVARVGNGDFVPVAEPVDVAPGDAVGTDVSGYAEIAYFDGSVSRLDVETRLEVVELVDDPGESRTRTRLTAGRTWNRVETLTGNDTFEVETSVATAAVRGTAFSIDCRAENACTFTAIEGSIDLELGDGSTIALTAPQTVSVVGGVAVSPPKTMSFDAVFSDEWYLDNANRDEENGQAGAVQMFSDLGPAFAGISGTVTALVTHDSTDCVGPDDACTAFADWVAEATASDPDRTYVFTTACDTESVCEIMADIEWLLPEGKTSGQVAVEFDGVSYKWRTPDSTTPLCTEPDDGLVIGHIEYEMVVDTATEANGRYVAEAVSGSSVALNVVGSGADVCGVPSLEYWNNHSSFEGSFADSGE